MLAAPWWLQKSLRTTQALRSRWFLILASALVTLLLASGLGVRDAIAFEGEHYTWTYFLALELGFTKRQAYQIASGAYALDWDRHTGPMEATPGDAIFGADHNGYFGTEHPEIAGIWRDFHAFADETILGRCGLVGKDLRATVGPTLSVWSRLKGNIPLSVGLVPIIGPHLTVGEIEQLPECPPERKMAIFASRQARRDELWTLATTERNPGPLIHYVQDYYSHFQYTNYRGHALAGHAPDFMSWNRNSAIQMTNDTLGVLLDFRDLLGTFIKDKDPGGSNLLRQKFLAPDINHIYDVLELFTQANPAPSSTPIDKILKAHPDFTLAELSQLPKTGDIYVFDPDGALRAAPDIGNYVAVVNKAIRADEDAGRLQKWPSAVEPYHWMPPKWSQYSYTSTGHIEETDQAAVEKVELEFGTETVKYTALDEGKSKYKVSLSLPYKISGLARIFRTPNDLYLHPVPAIERHELGNNKILPKRSEPFDKALSNGNYEATYEAELTREEIESGDYSWDVSVQLYGYEPKTKTVLLQLPYQACAPKEGKIRETVLVPNEWPGSRTQSRYPLEKGKCYTLDIRGDRLGTDAVYCFADWRCGPDRGKAFEELKLAGSGLLEGTMGPVPYKQDHHYQIGFVGQGKSLIVAFSSADATGELYQRYRGTGTDGCNWNHEPGTVYPESPACNYQVDIIAPDIAAPEVKLGLSEGKEKRVTGVVVKPPRVKDAVSWEVRRAENPEGPWTMLAMDLLSDARDPLTDSFPSGLKGTRTWHYITVPKTGEQIGKSVVDPDTTTSASIRLSLSIEPPRLKAESKAEAELESRKPPQPGREAEVEGFTERRRLVLSWEPPQVSDDLKKVNDVRLDLYRSVAGDPFLHISSYPAEKGSLDRHENMLPGLPVRFRARFISRTNGGIIASDWSEIEAALPEWRHATLDQSFGADRGIAGGLPVGPDQRVRLTCSRIVYKSSHSFEPYFTQHGPEGMDEALFQRFSREQREKVIREFWERFDQKARQERRAELEKELGKNLESREKEWFDWHKANAPLPGAKLGAVIGKFVPEIFKEDGSPDHSREAWSQKNEKAVYFPVGQVGEFTAPGYGYVSFTTNWTSKQDRGTDLEAIDQLFVTMRYLSLAKPPRPVPRVGPPEWKPGDGQSWKVKLEPLWTPGPGEIMQVLSGASEDGPWFEAVTREAKEVTTKPLRAEYGHILAGQRSFFRTRMTVAALGYLGEAWTEPVALAREMPTLKVGRGAPDPTLYGRRGQTLRVRVSGAWEVLRMEGLKPYGPEGIAEDVFQEKAKEYVEKEKSAKPQEGASNQPNLLGLVLETPGPKEQATGGLRDVRYFLAQKGSLRSRDLPAGGLVASFRPSRSALRLRGDHRPFEESLVGSEQTLMQVTRDWTFTFPVDGQLEFFPNESRGWVGSHYFEGQGQLQLDVSPGPAPKSSEDSFER